MTRRRLAAGLAAMAVALAAASPAEATLKWRPCEENAQCARLTVPLDRSGAIPGTTSLRVLREVTSARRAAGVMLVLGAEAGASAVEVMAGELSVGDPLHRLGEAAPSHRIVTFDQRGTGGSGPLRCRDLEAATPTDAGREAEACAALLGPPRALYRTSETVADIEALRAELAVERLTIVGVGYGGYVAQRYALTHPERVERLVLDSPVDAAGLDPLRLDSLAAARRVLALTCRRGCASFTRDAVGDVAALSERLAREPLRGRIVGLDGSRRSGTLTPEDMLFALANADPVSQADYPAAVSAAMQGDSAPLFRLKRRAVIAAKGMPPPVLSAATRAAVLCEEMQFPWAWHATAPERDAAAAAAGVLLSAELVSPFGARAAIRSDLVRLCHRWPTASSAPPPEPGPMPDVPALVIASATNVAAPLETARRTAARFPRATLVVAPSFLGHPLFDDSFSCVEVALRQFMADRRVQPRCPRLGPLIPPSRPPATSLAELRPVAGVPAKRGRVLRAIELTLHDWFDEFIASLVRGRSDATRQRGTGLRGGHWVIFGDERSRFDDVVFVPGVRVTFELRSGDDRPILEIDGPGRLDGRVRLVESDSDDYVYRVRGRLGQRRVRAKLNLRSRFVEAFARVDEVDR